MRAAAGVKKRVAILVAVAAIGLGASACLPDAELFGAPHDPFRQEILRQMNAHRGAHGLPGLMHSPKLDLRASVWSVHMGNSNSLFHSDLGAALREPDYANFFTLGENILVGPGSMSPGQMVAAWMNSAPHRANILNPNFNAVGIGVWTGPDGRLWSTVDFGGLR